MSKPAKAFYGASAVVLTVLLFAAMHALPNDIRLGVLLGCAWTGLMFTLIVGAVAEARHRP